MNLYGNGRASLVDDRATAEAVGWPRRRRSLPEPEVLLGAREGDPRREPWIAPGWWPRARGAAALWARSKREPRWSYIPGVPALPRYLARLAETPSRHSFRLGVVGLGRIGGTVTAALMATPARCSRIAEVYVHDSDQTNQQRWLFELEAIAPWRGGAPTPPVQAASLARVFARSDLVLFCAAHEVPPVGSHDDVRLSQFDPNREILRAVVAAAGKAEYSGLLLVVSDPVECLAQAAFHDSNATAKGQFIGDGLAPERIGGLALGVMWSRALAAARKGGFESAARRRGAAFGPHSTEVVVFDDVRRPDPRRSALLSTAARKGNFRLREIGYLPFVGPAFSSVALTLPLLLAGREVLASTFLDGVYFGAPGRYEWGLYAAPRLLARQVREELSRLYAVMHQRVESLGLTF